MGSANLIPLLKKYCYGVSSNLFVGTQSIQSSSGCQQGDPLGPLLFALVLHPRLLYLRESLPSLTIGAYLDDLTLAGPSREVNDAVLWLQQEGPNHGLHMSYAKSIVWSPFGRDLRADGLFGNITHCTDEGVELLGGAVSSSHTFVSSVIKKRVDKCIETLDRMMALADPQLCLLLLRACEGMPKLVYSWRTTPPEFLSEQAPRFDQEVLDALRWIVVGDGAHFNSFSRRLATLPVTLGGLGIQLPSDLRKFTFVASALSSFHLQQAILGSPAPPTRQDMPDDLDHYLDVAVQSISVADAPALREKVLQQTFDSDHANVPHFNTQLFLARAFSESTQERLFHHAFITSKPIADQRRFRGIIKSNCHPGASAWLFAMPNHGLRQRMTPLEFQSAACLRLLIPQFARNAPCQQNSCSALMDPYGYHALVCRGHQLPRHNTVRDALFDLMKFGRFEPKRDAPVTCLGYRSDRPTQLKPADLLMAGEDYEHDCVDVTVVSPLVTNNQAEIVVGHSAQQAERRKHEKHAAACEAAGFGFLAFAVDVFGVLAPEAKELLKRVYQKIIRETGMAPHKAISICQRRISISVTK